MSILKERQRTHGLYSDTAKVAQMIKSIIAEYNNGLSFIQRESLDLIATKMARILSGDADEPDHWVDVAGYADLVVFNLKDKKTASGATATVMEKDPDETIGTGDDWDSYYIPRSGLPR